MKLVFVTEARFIKDDEEKIYGNAAFDERIWNRYLAIFQEIIIVGRILNVGLYTGDFKNISIIKNIKFIELPYFIGLKEYLLKRFIIKRIVKKLVIENKESHFICRIPGTIGNIVISELNNIQKTYAVEVVGDPWDVFAPGSINHILRPVIRLKATWDLKKNVKNANAALYVTKESLQKRYPLKNGGFTINASNVNIHQSDLALAAKTHSKKNTYHLISVGSLEQMYKSPDVVIKALNVLYKKGINCHLTWLGGGKYLESMKKLASELKVAHLIDFKGDVEKDVVKYLLTQSDLFILASKTEGLPRAVIEAMAAGLPCIGTNVGGIPELLDKAVLVPKGCEKSLAQKIEEVLLNPTFYNQQAARNLNEARNYSEDILSQRRNLFYKYILENL